MATQDDIYRHKDICITELTWGLLIGIDLSCVLQVLQVRSITRISPSRVAAWVVFWS